MKDIDIFMQLISPHKLWEQRNQTYLWCKDNIGMNPVNCQRYCFVHVTVRYSSWMYLYVFVLYEQTWNVMNEHVELFSSWKFLTFQVYISTVIFQTFLLNPLSTPKLVLLFKRNFSCVKRHQYSYTASHHVIRPTRRHALQNPGCCFSFNHPST